jgi:hypothetical protein
MITCLEQRWPITRRYRPFSSGIQAADWQDANCNRCTKYKYEFHKDPGESCPIDVALLFAMFGDGKVSRSIATRMGFLDEDGKKNGDYVWKCAEWEPTEEWKAEWRKLQGKPEDWEPPLTDEERREAGQLSLMEAVR